MPATHKHHASANRLFKDATVYGVGTFVGQIIPFLLLPILTRYLTPQEYGIISVFIVTTSIVVNFVGLNLPAAVQRIYVDLSSKELSHYIGTAFVLICAASIVLLGVFYGARDAISKLTAIPPSWVAVIILVTFCQAIIALLQVIWRMERKAKHFVMFQISMTAANLGLSILFVVGLLWHWQGRVLGIVCSAVLFGMISLFLLNSKGYFRFRFKREHARYMLLFSLPLIPHTLSTWIITASDRLFVVNMVGASALGIYSVGYALGQIIQLVQHAFSQAWVPFLFEELKKDRHEIRVKVVKCIYLHHVVIFVLVILLHIVAPYFLTFFVGDSFQGASQFVLWVASGYALNGMYRMVIPILNYANKTKFVPIGSVVAAVVNLGLNYILISRNGAIGAAQATFFSFLVFYVITFYFTFRAYKMPWLFWLSKTTAKIVR